MADATYPIEELMGLCRDALASVGGAAAPHDLGRRFDFANKRPPRYVWVPIRTRPEPPAGTPAVDEHRSLGSDREFFAIGCFGRTYKETYLMRRNLRKALHDQAYADVHPEPSEWERASEAWNQNGELYVATYSMGLPMIDVFTALDPAAEEPVRATVMPTGIEANVQQTDDLTQVGEPGVEGVDTTP